MPPTSGKHQLSKFHQHAAAKQAADFCKCRCPEKAKTTRQVGPDSHKWLLAEDVAIEKRKRDLIDNWDDSYSHIGPNYMD